MVNLTLNLNLNKEFKQEQQYIILYQKFSQEHPDLLPGLGRRKAFLKSMRVKEGQHIYQFFTQKLKSDDWLKDVALTKIVDMSKAKKPQRRR